jgi:hypothetical protein
MDMPDDTSLLKGPLVDKPAALSISTNGARHLFITDHARIARLNL